MADIFPIDPQNLSVVSTDNTSSLYSITGITMVKAVAKSATTFTTLTSSHFYKSILGIHSDLWSTIYDVNWEDGGQDNTMLEKISDAYNQTGAWFGFIDDVEYANYLNPNMEFILPITGATAGDLSGVTTLRCYTAFVDDESKLNKDNCCAAFQADALRSESYQPPTVNTGIGAALGPNNNGIDSPYESGVMFIFTDDLTFSGSSTGTSWSLGFSAATPHTTGGKKLANYLPTNLVDQDRAIGVINVNGGYFSIWDPDIVPFIDTSLIVNGTPETGATFSQSDLRINAKTVDKTTDLNVNIMIPPGTNLRTDNPSMVDALLTGAAEGCDDFVLIDTISLYNTTGDLIAVASSDTPIQKDKNDNFVATLTFNLDGGILDEGPWISRGVVT